MNTDNRRNFGCFEDGVDIYNRFLPNASELHNLIAATTLVFVAVLVISTNCIALVGMKKRRIWKRQSMRFLMLLVLTDMVIGAITLPLHCIVYARPKLLKSSTKLNENLRFFRTFPIILSMLTVFLIAIDRCLAILKAPLHRIYATNRSVSLVMLIAIVVAFLIGVMDFSELLETRVKILTSMVCLGVLKTLLFMAVSIVYLMVTRSVRRTAATTRISFNNTVSPTPSYDRTFSRISMLLCISFMVCHLPSIICHFYNASQLIMNNCSAGSNTFYLTTWTNVPMFLNSFLNGTLLIYGNRKLKRWFVRTCIEIFEYSRNNRSISPSNLQRKNAMIADHSEQKTIQRVAINFNVNVLR